MKLNTKKIFQTQSSEKQKQNWISFLKKFDWDYFATFTFLPQSKGFIGGKKALQIQEKVFNQLPIKITYYFTVAEPHRWRDDVHLHTLLIAKSLNAKTIENSWLINTRAKARVSPVNKNAEKYVAKYLGDPEIITDFYIPKIDKRRKS